MPRSSPSLPGVDNCLLVPGRGTGPGSGDSTTREGEVEMARPFPLHQLFCFFWW